MANCSALFLSVMKSTNYFIAPIVSNPPIFSSGSLCLSEVVGLEVTLFLDGGFYSVNRQAVTQLSSPQVLHRTLTTYLQLMLQLINVTVLVWKIDYSMIQESLEGPIFKSLKHMRRRLNIYVTFDINFITLYVLPCDKICFHL